MYLRTAANYTHVKLTWPAFDAIVLLIMFSM